MMLDHPRQQAISAMKASVPADIWNANLDLVALLRERIGRHPVTSHPAIAALNAGLFDSAAMKHIHLEYRHAIVQIFTDALLMTQFQSKQLEPRLAPGTKMYARFLLTLNDLDEFGFRPGVDVAGYYRGNPRHAHYPLFEALLDQLGVGAEERRGYVPSGPAREVRAYLESAYDNFGLLAALLAVAEQEVVLYSPPLRRNTKTLGVDVSSGYYYVHGTTDEHETEAYDDDHEADLWAIVVQAALPEQFPAITEHCLHYCDLWCAFWSEQMAILGRQSQAADR